MASQGEEQATKLLGAQTHILNYLFGFMRSMALKCAIDLGILDSIHKYGKPMPLSQLVSSLSINPSKTDSIYRLMRLLTIGGFFSQHNVSENVLDVSYVLTDSSMLLVTDHPLSARPYYLGMIDPMMPNPWYKLPEWFKNDDPTPIHTTYGMKLWEYTSREPKVNQLLNDALASDSRLVSHVVIDKSKWVFEGLESLVDVGGGTGTMAKVIAKSFPQMKCTVYDLPHVVAGLDGTENVKYVGGDMFEAIPAANAIMFKNVLHDWNDEECIKLLKNCKKALEGKGKNAKVILLEIVLKNEVLMNEAGYNELFETQLFADMLMMTFVPGNERTEKDFAKLFSAAGFKHYNITPSLGIRSIIEVYP